MRKMAFLGSRGDRSRSESSPITPPPFFFPVSSPIKVKRDSHRGKCRFWGLGSNGTENRLNRQADSYVTQ